MGAEVEVLEDVETGDVYAGGEEPESAGVEAPYNPAAWLAA